MRRQWLSSRALAFHLVVAVVVPVCLWAGWWQYHVAESGNTLSWAYTFEWPCFAVIAVVAWWHLIHEDPAERDERARKADLDDRTSICPDQDVCMGPDAVTADLAARIAAAARKELDAHLAKLEETEGPGRWRTAAPPA